MKCADFPVNHKPLKMLKSQVSDIETEYINEKYINLRISGNQNNQSNWFGCLKYSTCNQGMTIY